ncbi:Uncharacterised protein (plasmid) [Tsukamurella tyrosinosolvens]|uniref:Uncharacterized protein n=1 Tax=Tsukamurella tyrosinosolvens TaxID=57704 RepID=A0A1H4WS97_TSUTY|nr:hypothetical protein [Tsukamurella tyrosinosolvens]SEC96186.1 hypothetical protein SAMN04489793_3656 [Tsukamurella tyrosinosolvens]VEH89535.1 Uncharacterised protein [Tsukamurella tyrosinosolvens]
MTEDASLRWDALPEGQRHPKNLAILAVEHLVMPASYPCRVTVLQDVDYRKPEISVLVALPDGRERTVKILDGDDPVTLAARIRGAADQLVSDSEGA